MAKLSIKEAQRAYADQLAEVERQLEAATARVEAGELALRRATAEVVRAGAGMALLSGNEDYAEARRELELALGKRSDLDARRAVLQSRIRGLEGR